MADIFDDEAVAVTKSFASNASYDIDIWLLNESCLLRVSTCELR